MKVIYIIGPFRAPTPWQIEQNVRRAEEVALKLWKQGYAVICAHAMTRFYQHECSDKVWIQGTTEIMTRCDAVYVLKGWENSVGSGEELGLAINLELEIIYE